MWQIPGSSAYVQMWHYKNQLICHFYQQFEGKLIIFKHNFTKTLLFVLQPILSKKKKKNPYSSLTVPQILKDYLDKMGT